MNCKNCGGNLTFHNGIYICENCALQQTVSVLFENTEVFLCYLESDEQGRRCRDSVIAQDLYNKLENAKIRTFYQRISAAALTESDFETANTIAFDYAKVIAVIATTPENFQKLIEKYGEKLGTKKVIPIYSGMNANDMPQEIKPLQAVNYDTVGSVADFTKNILRILGREQEVDIVEAANKHFSRRKKTAIISVCCILALTLLAVSYIVFGTPYVLKSKKYEFAEMKLQQGDYIQSVSLFKTLKNYRDSDNKVTSILNQYDGYYKSEDGNCQLHFDMMDNNMINVEFTQKTIDSKTVRFSEMSAMENNRAIVQFVDSQNNRGNAELVLSNQGINLKINMDSKIQAPAISEGEFIFLLQNKSDRRLNVLDTDTLINWLKDGKSVNELILDGIEFEKEYFHPRSLSGKYVKADIKNTDITVYWARYDEQFNLIENERDKSIIMIDAPAYILIPDKINTPIKPFVQNDIFYMPDSGWGGEFGYYTYSSENIAQDTNVTILYKGTFSDNEWLEIIQRPKPENQKSIVQ